MPISKDLIDWEILNEKEKHWIESVSPLFVSCLCVCVCWLRDKKQEGVGD